jgi:hypothetical protein
MIFIVRSPQPDPPAGVRVVQVRRAPTESHRLTDLFCVGDADAGELLAAAGWIVVPLHDGWYADDRSGGVAVWGNGRYWEVRDTPFDVREHDSPEFGRERQQLHE